MAGDEKPKNNNDEVFTPAFVANDEMENTIEIIEPSELDSYEPTAEDIEQLDVLLTLVTEAKLNDIDIIVCGGYGLDGLYGKLTRAHEDFDLVIEDQGMTTLIAQLEAGDYTRDNDESDNIKHVYTPNDKPEFKIEIAPLSALSQLAGVEASTLVSDEANAMLSGTPFKSLTVEGHLKLIEIQNQRAEQDNWGDYDPVKKRNQELLVEALTVDR